MGPYIALAGSLGAVCRFVLDGHIKTRYKHFFPWATFVINVSGSLILGTVSGILLKHHGFASAEAIIGTGFCGGYTTFTTASFQTVRLLEERRYSAALLGNTLGTLLAACLAAGIGIALGMTI